MPNEAEHTRLAVHNIHVVAYLLERSDFCDWTATATFYVAVHIVEAVFFKDTRHVKLRHGYKHETREQILKGTKSYENIWRHYRPLQSASVKARYLQGLDKGLTFQQHMSAKQVEERLIRYHLAQLIRSTGKFVSAKCRSACADAFDGAFK
jgi:hypothetical protein